MSSVQTMNKKQICKLWGVQSSFLNKKLKQVTEIIQSDLYEEDILQLLNKHGMNVESVILDILESDPPNHRNHNRNHNHNQNRSISPPIDNESPPNQERNLPNRRTRKRRNRRSKNRRNLLQIKNSSNVTRKSPERNLTNRRKRKRDNTPQDIEDAPAHKRRKVTTNDKDEKQEIIALITSILNEHKRLNRDQLLTKLNSKLQEKNLRTWRRGYQSKLGLFEEFVTSIKGRIEVSQSHKRNFRVELKDHEIETMESMEEDDGEETDKESDTDGMDLDVASENTEPNAIAMSLSLDPSDTESIEILNKSDSFIFPEFEHEIEMTLDVPPQNRARSSKEERDSDDDEEEEEENRQDTPEPTTNTSMKAEADTEDDTEDDEETKSDHEAPAIIVRNKNTKAKNEKWSKKTFHRFQFKYTVIPKTPPSWCRFNFADVKGVQSVKDLYNLQSTHTHYGRENTMEYDGSHVCEDESVVKQLYDTAFEELHQKLKKPKRDHALGKKKKKNRKDYTIQSVVKHCKRLHKKGEAQKKQYRVDIEIQMHRFAKTGNCFIVDIPATIALTSKSNHKALQEDIYESLNLMREYRAKGHQQTSISLLDFACRYNDDGMKPFKFGAQCRMCYKIPITNQKELPCGHRFCATCIAAQFQISTKCPVCRRKYAQNVDLVADLLIAAMILPQEEAEEEEEEEEDEQDEFISVMARMEEQEKYGLNVIAFPYQVQSIEWMLERENDAEGLYKYLFRKGTFKNGQVFHYSAVLNRLVLATQLPVLRGGFLCEEMGLGKTIECLAVIHCNRRSDTCGTSKQLVTAFKETALRKRRVEIKQKKPTNDRNNNNNESDEDADVMRIKAKKKIKKLYKFVEENREYTYYKGKGTLIIGPVSLVGQWEHEVDTRSSGALRYKRYYGQRSRNIRHYMDFDIVFTTFGVLAKEDGHDRKNHVLHRIEWHRIILDESHYIKNGAARTSININELQANQKWLLSGTPFERPMDLFNQLKFIGIDQEYINAMGLKEKSVRPWQRKEYSKALIKVVKYMMMRHKKGQKFNDKCILRMPEKEEDVIYVEFEENQKEYYNKLYATAKQCFDSFKATGNISRGFIPILSSLHPARQACSGYIANMNAIEEQLSAAQENSHKIRIMVQRNKHKSSKELYELARDEAYNKDGQCVICLECPPDEPLQTPCRHIFCGECIRAQLEANGECPICRKKTEIRRLKLPLSEKKEEEKESANENNNSNNSNVKENENENETQENKENVIKFDAKLKVLVNELNILKRERPEDKSLIFTSFSKSLDWICCELERNGIKYSTLTGSMTMNKRAKNLKAFSTSPDVKVFVLTVRTGAVGLTLTAANHVFMMEPTFNPALHRQAINRVYRLGQDKKVFIHTLIMKDSIEERIWNLNKEKQKGDIDNNKNQNMYGNIKDDKAGALQTTEIEKLFTI